MQTSGNQIGVALNVAGVRRTSKRTYDWGSAAALAVVAVFLSGGVCLAANSGPQMLYRVSAMRHIDEYVDTARRLGCKVWTQPVDGGQLILVLRCPSIVRAQVTAFMQLNEPDVILEQQTP